jgi:sugar-specific transcriptional regulator TrmB
MNKSELLKDKIDKLKEEYKKQKEEEKRENRNRKNDTKIKILLGSFVKSNSDIYKKSSSYPNLSDS